MTANDVIKIVKKYVTEHIKCVLPLQIQGQAYYLTKNPDIVNRKMEYFSSAKAVPVEDPYKANNKTASAYSKILVDQKISYSINEKTVLSKTPAAKVITDTLNFKRFKRVLRKVCKDSSNKIYGAIQVYIKDTGEFAYKHIPSEQIIPINNSDDEEVLDAVIRYYTIQIPNDKGESKTAVIAEYWDKDLVWYLIKEEDSDEYKMCPLEMYAINPMPHIVTQSVIGAEVVASEVNSWKRPPFAILHNNDEHQRDIDPVLPLIKVWDIVMSDFANNLQDFQDVFWILKGYGGQDIDEFFDEVKRLKVIKTDEDGSATTEKVEIPTEAREKMLDRLNKAIYRFGRGVDSDDIQGDATNVRIKSLYYMLDLKANEFEMAVNDFFDQTQELLNRYNELTGKPTLDTTESDLTFKRAMILNKAEVIDSLIKQIGFISNQTLLEQHPDIDNVEDELKRIKEEKSAMVDELGGELGFDKEDDKKDVKV